MTQLYKMPDEPKGGHTSYTAQSCFKKQYLSFTAWHSKALCHVLSLGFCTLPWVAHV